MFGIATPKLEDPEAKFDYPSLGLGSSSVSMQSHSHELRTPSLGLGPFGPEGAPQSLSQMESMHTNLHIYVYMRGSHLLFDQ